MNEEALKQEAKEYLRRQTQLNGGGIFHCNILNLILGFAEPREKCIAELEKENAELKSEKGCETCTKFDEVKLAKAKEIIKTFLGFAEAFGYSPSMDKFIAEAEQFVK